MTRTRTVLSASRYIWLFLLFCSAAQAEWARVAHVLDGDTVILEDRRHVRLLAINTPEVAGKTRAAEPGGEAAKRWLKQRVEGQRVRLEKDRDKRDKYGRWLYYLFDRDGDLLNERLLANGLAVLSIHPPNLKYQARLQLAEGQAEAKELGIWGMPDYRPLLLPQLLAEKRQGWQRVRLTPEAIKCSRKYARLAAGSGVDVRIAKSNLRYFPDLDAYLGCELEVRGWVSWQKDRASILIRHPSAVITRDCH